MEAVDPIPIFIKRVPTTNAKNEAMDFEGPTQEDRFVRWQREPGLNGIDNISSKEAVIVRSLSVFMSIHFNRLPEIIRDLLQEFNLEMFGTDGTFGLNCYFDTLGGFMLEYARGSGLGQAPALQRRLRAAGPGAHLQADNEAGKSEEQNLRAIKFQFLAIYQAAYRAGRSGL